MGKFIDLRSDTVTRPTSEMRKAMAEAEVGDDVYKDDPTVNRLEDIATKVMKTEASLFFPTGTQSNLCALLSHCQRGDEYICGQTSHSYKYEAGGAAVLGSIQPQPIETEADGTLDLEKVESCIKADDIHFAKTRLLVIENTTGGKALDLDYMKKAVLLAKHNGLNTHLDGARIFNASVALGVNVSQISSLFDSVSVCLSKGLGAPAGTVLCGKKDLIERAVRWRKMTGGGMRQSGILAAAGIIALEKMSLRLQEDHDNARLFSDILRNKAKLNAQHHTNMVFITLNLTQIEKINNAFNTNRIKSSVGIQTRFVFHYDISRQDAEKTGKLIASVLS